MREIVGACLSQFHDDADRFELLLAYSDGREIGHSVSRTVAQKIAAELIDNAGGDYAAKDAEIERLRAELKEREEALIDQAAEEEIRRYWGAFCDADPFPNRDTFADRMEARGLLELVPVTKAALQDSFAAERGLEPGGMMYLLTPAGRHAVSKPAVLSKQKSTDG